MTVAEPSISDGLHHPADWVLALVAPVTVSRTLGLGKLIL